MEEKIKVLIIDDEPSVAEALKLILEDNGYEAATARNGISGLEQAERQHFDVVITDLRLPDISGLDVLKAFCKLNPNGSVILITSYSTPEVFAEAVSCGAVGTLPKPFGPSDILNLITDALARRQAATASPA